MINHELGPTEVVHCCFERWEMTLTICLHHEIQGGDDTEQTDFN